MADLLNHRHCKNCERATPFERDLCGEACESAWKAIQKKRSRTVILFYVAGAVTVILLVNQLLGKF